MPHKHSSAIPTNIITGFLGVGKTSAILHLLQRKPARERWAILVNEFGEIGVDGSLFEGQHSQEQGIFVREVPGGCMCCTAGLSMQVALNLLLTEATPDRLLIEPTGLGHPLEVLQVLSSPHYQDILSIQSILTLVDARRLTDNRIIQNNTFNQQIAIADIIIGNKRDLYQPQDETALQQYAQQKGAPHARVFITEQGALDPSWLEGNTQAITHHTHPHGHDHTHGHDHHPHDHQDTHHGNEPKPIKAINEGEGFQSIGWRFSPAQTFDRDALLSCLRGLQVERLKGVFITQSGIFGYNATSDEFTEHPLNECMESRIEVIATQIDDKWEQTLLGCLLPS